MRDYASWQPDPSPPSPSHAPSHTGVCTSCRVCLHWQGSSPCGLDMPVCTGRSGRGTQTPKRSPQRRPEEPLKHGDTQAEPSQDSRPVRPLHTVDQQPWLPWAATSLPTAMGIHVGCVSSVTGTQQAAAGAWGENTHQLWLSSSPESVNKQAGLGASSSLSASSCWGAGGGAERGLVLRLRAPAARDGQAQVLTRLQNLTPNSQPYFTFSGNFSIETCTRPWLVPGQTRWVSTRV